MRILRLRHLNEHIFRRFKVHVTPLQDSPTLYGLLEKLVHREIPIKNIYDVGAYKGLWSRDVRKIFPNAQFTLIEPNEIHNESIYSLGFRPFNLVLSKLSGENVLFYSRGQTGDSYFLEKNSDYLGSEREMVTKSLSDFITENELEYPDFLKIDTQGSELEILMGAQPGLHLISVILVELPITSLNIGAATLSEVTSYLEENDFVPIHLSEIHNVIDILIQVDIAFLRRDIFNLKFGHDDIAHRDVRPIL
jgi:FkbM family methyltransferase